jgi:hypothetical protein
MKTLGMFSSQPTIRMNRLINPPAFFAALVATLLFSATASPQRLPDGPDVSIDAKTRSGALQSLEKVLREEYVFPDMGEKLATMLQTRQARGEYDSVISAKAFSELLTSQMREVSQDRHLRVRYSSEVIGPDATGDRRPPPLPEEVTRMAKVNYSFDRVERLSGNVGYLKFDRFQNAQLCGSTVAAAMSFLANTDALIIDLRGNGGGSPATVALVASYFFSGDQPVHLNDIAYRRQGTSDYEIRQSWTLPYVPGQRYLGKEVYILTSHMTFSGGEEFTYDLQTLKRATIVGEVTRGGANPGGTHRLADHLAVFIPDGHAINPVTHTNWEGTGITPDIAVPPEDALKIAHRTALEHLIAKTTGEEELGALKQALAIVDIEHAGQR